MIGMAVLLAACAAGAENFNGAGVSLNLPTTDLSSGAAQTNPAGGRLVVAGTPGAGAVSVNAAGATAIFEPMNALAGAGSGTGLPAADFSADLLTGAAPLDVRFTDRSSGGLYQILSWTWDFGDGSPINDEQNPAHTYENTGTYTVTLTILTNAGGTASETKEDYIRVVQGLPVVNWIALLILAMAMVLTGGALLRKQCFKS